MNKDLPSNINCIIVGPDHYNTLNLLRSICQEYSEAYTILISSSIKCLVTTSKYAKFGCRISSYLDIPSILLDIGRKINTKIPVIATNDRAISTIDTHFKELSEYFYLPNCHNETNRIIDEMDKGRQVRVAERNGFKVPKSISFDLIQNFQIPTNISFPCIVKPIKSINGSKLNMKVCDNIRDLQMHLNSISEIAGRCQIQQFIPNDRFFLIGGVRLPNNITIIPGIIEKLKFGHKNHTLGLAAFGKLSPIKKSVKDKCIAYLEDIDYNGPFSFELVYSQRYCKSEEDLFFIELNLRTDGLFYFYDRVNLSLGLLWINYFNIDNGAADYFEVREPIYGMCETLYVSEYLTPKGIVSAIKDLCKTQVFCYYNRKDIRPFLAKFIKFYYLFQPASV